MRRANARCCFRDDTYLARAIHIVGGVEGLSWLQVSFRSLLSLSRPRISAELMSRLDAQAWAEVRDRVRFLSTPEIACEVIKAEARNRYGWLHAELCPIA